MSDAQVSNVFPQAADAKGLYREMFNSPLRRNVQPNAGRVQQAGKESYYAGSNARRADFWRARWHLSQEDPVIEVAQAHPGYAVWIWGLVKIVSTGYVEYEDIVARLWRWNTKCGLPDSPGPLQRAGEFIGRAGQLDRRGQTDAALDLIYDQIDTLLRSGDLPRIDAVLQRADVNSLSTDLLLGLLTATLPARTRLASRRGFFNRVEAVLRKRGDWEDGLLNGLES